MSILGRFRQTDFTFSETELHIEGDTSIDNAQSQVAPKKSRKPMKARRADTCQIEGLMTTGEDDFDELEEEERDESFEGVVHLKNKLILSDEVTKKKKPWARRARRPKDPDADTIDEAVQEDDLDEEGLPEDADEFAPRVEFLEDVIRLNLSETKQICCQVQGLETRYEHAAS